MDLIIVSAMVCVTFVICTIIFTKAWVQVYQQPQGARPLEQPTPDTSIEEQLSEAYSVTRELQRLFLDDDQIAKEDQYE